MDDVLGVNQEMHDCYLRVSLYKIKLMVKRKRG